MNYHNKKFKVVSNSENGEVSSDMIFHYQQNANILTCTYSGSLIQKGQLIGIVSSEGVIKLSYQQVNTLGELMTGNGMSTPSILPSGKIRLSEVWQWTSGDLSQGESILEEI